MYYQFAAIEKTINIVKYNLYRLICVLGFNTSLIGKFESFCFTFQNTIANVIIAVYRQLCDDIDLMGHM